MDIYLPTFLVVCGQARLDPKWRSRFILPNPAVNKYVTHTLQWAAVCLSAEVTQWKWIVSGSVSVIASFTSSAINAQHQGGGSHIFSLLLSTAAWINAVLICLYKLPQKANTSSAMAPVCSRFWSQSETGQRRADRLNKQDVLGVCASKMCLQMTFWASTYQSGL